MTAVATINRPPESGGLRELVQLAWPLVLTNGCWTIQIFLDRVFLGQYSGNDMAATLPAVVIFWSIQNFFFHTAAYVATFVAQYTGAGRPRRIGPAVGQALYFCLIGGAFFLGLAPYSGDLMNLIGHEGSLPEKEAVFFRILCYGAFPELIKATTFSFFNGRGHSRTVLMISLLSLTINALLDWLLIFGRYGFPEMGIAGAGWATVTASTVAAVVGFALMLQKRHRDECGTGEFWRFDRELFLRLLRFGVPNGLYVALETGAFGAFTLVLGWFGVRELAASNMAFTLNMVSFLPTLGIGQAVEILVGRHLGEDRPDRAENRTNIGFAIGWVMMTVVAVAFYTVPGFVLWPFITKTNAEEIAMARRLLRFVAFYSLFDAANVTFAFALRGAGDTAFVTKMMTALPWLAMVLPAYLSYRYGWGVYVAWGFASFYVAVLALAFYARFRNGSWKSMRVIEPA